MTPEERKARFDAIADKHAARLEARVAALNKDALDKISGLAMEHGEQYLQTLLNQGRAPEDAKQAAIDEAERLEKHLQQTLYDLADDQLPKQTLFCANEGRETEHVLTVDRNGETVATCACGRFKKFVPNYDFEHPPTGEEPAA